MHSTILELSDTWRDLEILVTGKEALTRADDGAGIKMDKEEEAKLTNLIQKQWYKRKAGINADIIYQLKRIEDSEQTYTGPVI